MALHLRPLLPREKIDHPVMAETPLRSSHARAQLVLPPPARKSALTTVGRVIEIETLEFILAGRGDRDIAVRPAIRRRKNFPENRSCLSINRPVSSSLADRLADVARVEHERAH